MQQWLNAELGYSDSQSIDTKSYDFFRTLRLHHGHRSLIIPNNMMKSNADIAEDRSTAVHQRRLIFWLLKQSPSASR